MEMIGNVLIISLKEGVLLRGVDRKLKNSGIESSYIGIESKTIESFKDKTDVYIIILTENIRDLKKCIGTIKEICERMDKTVIVIGTKFETAEMKKAFPDLQVSMWYEKNVELDSLKEYIERELKRKAEYEIDKDCMRSILLVDDDPAYARMVREWLKDSYHVSIVTSGIQAIKYLVNNKVDLIFLDYEMPITNGPQVFEMLRSESSTEDVPIVFLTGVGDKDNVMKVMSLGPDGYLLKTDTGKQLKSYLDDFFSKY